MGLKLHHPADNKWTTLYSDVEFSYEQHSWCKENCVDAVYGGHNWRWAWDQKDRRFVVQFVNPKDATAYALRWL
jgi:hypothetical protein